MNLRDIASDNWGRIQLVITDVDRKVSKLYLKYLVKSVNDNWSTQLSQWVIVEVHCEVLTEVHSEVSEW